MNTFTPAFPRRDFLRTAGGTLAIALGSRRSQAASASLREISPGQMLISDCPLAGEKRADRVVPAHPNGLQLARDRFLVLYATRGFRGTDDDRSICYQLRSGDFTGPVLREGFLSRSTPDWDPLGDGGRYFRQHGHPVAFGVPKGARIRGQTPPHAGIFVAKWRVVAKAVGADGRLAESGSRHQRIGQGVEWVQFRLNADESDLEIIQPRATLRQRGFESGSAICPLPRYTWMNQTFINAVPFNDDASEWVDVNHFAGDRIAALRYAFDAKTGRYEWEQTSPWLIDPKGGISEASVLRWANDWIVAVRLSGAPVQIPGRPARPAHGVGWLRTEDLFGTRAGHLSFPQTPQCTAARGAYRCADGVVRIFGGDPFVPPPRGQTRSKRNPVYAWDIDIDRDFHASPPRMISNAFTLAPNIRRNSVPMLDMIKVMPSTGGCAQTLLHRFTFAPNTFPLTEAEFAGCGVYAARMEFDDTVPAAWSFES
jgi:hypothetical protein